MKIAVVAALLLVAGCASGPRIVKVPTPIPCVTGELPAEPESLQGRLSGNERRDIGLIAGAERETRAWGKGLYGMLLSCKG